jgi:NAD(P)-dependent dehydrogenase (short-subunit alcohol dehydrogenase family)
MSSSTKPLSGRVALITGANTGIGFVTARELAKMGAQVFIACRSVERAQSALSEIRAIGGDLQVEALPLDLGDFDSVRECARMFLARDLPLHLLVNNAGLAGARGFTKSGFELAFGVNHVGHFLLTQLLLERIKASAPARIVTVSSRAHIRVRGIDWNAVRQPTGGRSALKEYCVSKLANVLFSAELGRRLEGSGVTTYALHPGVVGSDVWRSLPWILEQLVKLFTLTTDKGAATSLYCATAPEAARETGLYYDKCKVKEASEFGRDPLLAATLWQRSEQWVLQYPDGGAIAA